MSDKTKGITALFESDEMSELSEDIKTKATVIFETAVADEVKTKSDAIQEDADAKLEEAKKEFMSDLEEKVNDYLTYASQEWMVENKIAIDAGVRAELTENFLKGMKDLFDENYVDVPEDKIDLIAEMSEKVEAVEKKLDDAVTGRIVAEKEVKGLKKTAVIDEVTAKMADTEIEKVKELLEDVDFEDAESFKSRVETVVETYFKDSLDEKDDDESDDDDKDDDKKDDKKKDNPFDKKKDESIGNRYADSLTRDPSFK
jgi:hypothetical protein